MSRLQQAVYWLSMLIVCAVACVGCSMMLSEIAHVLALQPQGPR